MGIKALKKAFNIGHIVHRRNDKICIGSPYVSELITIDALGNVDKSSIVDSDRDEIGQKYNALCKCDKLELLTIIDEPESFEDLKPVYVESDYGRIRKVFCEEYGWPNVTTDGELMYDNEFFKNRSDAVKHAIRNRMSETKYHCAAIANSARELLGQIKGCFCGLFSLVRLYILKGR